MILPFCGRTAALPVFFLASAVAGYGQDSGPVLVPANTRINYTPVRTATYQPRATTYQPTAAAAVPARTVTAAKTTRTAAPASASTVAAVKPPMVVIPGAAVPATDLPVVAASGGRFKNGVDVFMEKYAYLVKGKRVGLVTNPTGVDSQLRATVDLLRADSRVNLVALFAPEHGIRGDVLAGQNFKNERDPVTGLPVFSLYGGRDHKPPADGLRTIDVMIYSIQDVGSRAYTYIWHMAECMKACGEAGKTFIVLDVPNPLGGEIVDGPVSEPSYLSFIGLYPVPRVYGMTVGELARFLNAEYRMNCKLYVVPMHNYRRGMSWEQIGLPWVPTSPHIPSVAAACAFACTGIIGETNQLHIGIGYSLPFQVVAAPWMNAEFAAAKLNQLRLPGVKFRPIHFMPFFGPGAPAGPGGKGTAYHGVQIHIVNPAVFRPTATEVAILWFIRKHYPQFKWDAAASSKFDKAMGTASVRKMLQSGRSWEDIVRSWQPQLEGFKARRAKYLIYQ